MIEIRNNLGATLQLQPAVRLSIELASGFLADENVPGGFSYPIEFPLNEANREFLAHAYRPAAFYPSMELPVAVRIEGFLFRKCTLSYRIQDGSGSGHLKIDSGEIADRISKLKLSEIITDVLDFGPYSGAAAGQRAYEVAKLAPGNLPYTFFPVYNKSFMPPETEFNKDTLPNYAKSEYVNLITKSPQGVPYFESDQVNRLGYHLVPFFYLTWVLEKLFASLGYRISGNWLADPETRQAVIYNTTAMRSSANVGAIAIQVMQHLPDMTASDFLKGIRQFFALSYLFNPNQRICTIRTFSDIRSSRQVLDLAPYQLEGFGISPPKSGGYSISAFTDSGDDQYKEIVQTYGPPKPKRIGLGETEVQLLCGTLPMVEAINPALKTPWTVPSAQQTGNVYDPIYKNCTSVWNEPDQLPKNSFGLRLLRYRGLVSDSSGTSYPLGSSTVSDHWGNRVGKQGLQLDGVYGRWNQGLKQYYFFRNESRIAEVTALLPVGVLNQLDIQGKVGLRFTDMPWREYLINKINLETPAAQGLVLADLEVLTLPAKNLQQNDDYLVGVWVALEYRNRKTVTADTTSTATNPSISTITSSGADVWLTVWADPDKTQPLNVSNLSVKVKTTYNDFFLLTQLYDLQLTETHVINGTSKLIATNMALSNLAYDKASGKFKYMTTITREIIPTTQYNDTV